VIVEEQEPGVAKSARRNPRHPQVCRATWSAIGPARRHGRQQIAKIIQEIVDELDPT
jgi:hypothetical protein